MSPASNAERYARLLFAEKSREQEDKKSAWRGLAALLLAAAIHLCLCLQFGESVTHVAKLPLQVPILEVELVATATASEPPENIIPEPVEPAQQPVIQPAPPVQKPKPVKQKKLKKAQPKKKKITPAAIVHHQQALTTEVHLSPSPVRTPKAISNSVAVAREHQLSVLRRQYLAQIMRIIEARKSYPYSARRRHLEGDVTVSFDIDANGHINSIKISGKHGVLRSSSMDTVQTSGPLPAPSTEINSPVHATFIMRYRLTD